MKKAILCVDDEKTVLETLQRQLSTAFGKDYYYEMAESVVEAWEVIDDLVDQEYKVVLVISDWLMPGEKGDTFLVNLHNKYPDSIKILLTGQANPEAVENALENANLLAYIPKPWNVEKLISSIQTGFDNLKS